MKLLFLLLKLGFGFEGNIINLKKAFNLYTNQLQEIK